ncbi:MFS transporter [Spirilliplanes yamanashiensis]|uniref:MFS transporter n=1 Tax=Spirilliplanes yamanashiensis TaxID=42233 RepID=A0A8J4DIJ9_9ACTN|nr:MFS transporter [Spirilliplanes yamanashiensis]MDP9814595.1 hypothetical protein [Spirilliplanes yamanashiensis]GIJ02248.1 hypothetical protein Sya03_16000 [Spirilliplanes yamanashiensis]
MARRASALVLAVLVAAVATLTWAFLPASAASAAPAPVAQAPGDPLCSVEEWRTNMRGCVGRLQDVAASETSCLTAPTPNTPDSGLAGWFAARPESAKGNGPKGLYSEYGYAGYNYSTYDIGCASTLVAPEYKFETTVANGEFMLATSIIGASNALRERAWEPKAMWGWADPLVEQATKAVYEKVFSVFGVITLVVIGVYLLWRSRQADMNNAITTVSWAILVMAAVTALAAWPVKSANMADATLVGTLGVVHDAIGPRAQDRPPSECRLGGPAACEDVRPPAVRASDTATETMLYRNWLRGMLGSADSVTAQKYGRALYDAKALRWDEAERLRTNPADREATLKDKQNQFMRVANQIKTEDPEAYEYLKGVNGMDRIGAGFIALLAAALYAMFDLTASLLILLGFLIFRWAVIAAPILGTLGLLRPASAGLRRLGNAVVAAIFNIAIFGTGAAIYLFAVDLIMNTASLAGWLQVVLIWLCGVVGWLLLRPYRRITQLGGKDSSQAVSSAGSWHRRFFRDLREAAKLDPAEPGGTREPQIGKGRGVPIIQSTLRPEARLEDPAHANQQRQEVTAGGGAGTPQQDGAPARPDGVERVEPVRADDDGARRPARQPTRREPRWTSPDVPDAPATYAIYRPETAEKAPAPEQPRIRSEAR